FPGQSLGRFELAAALRFFLLAQQAGGVGSLLFLPLAGLFGVAALLFLMLALLLGLFAGLPFLALLLLPLAAGIGLGTLLRFTGDAGLLGVIGGQFPAHHVAGLFQRVLVGLEEPHHLVDCRAHRVGDGLSLGLEAPVCTAQVLQRLRGDRVFRRAGHLQR